MEHDKHVQPTPNRHAARRWCVNRPRPTALEHRFLRGRASATDAWGMKSRINPKYKTKYRVGNWAEYDQVLIQRGVAFLNSLALAQCHSAMSILLQHSSA